MRQKMPMISTREFLTLTTVLDTELDGKPAVYIFQRSVDHPKAPVVKGAIRAQMSMCGLVSKESDSSIRLTLIQHVNMGGWFPD